VTALQTARLRLEPMAEHHLDGVDAMDSLPEVMRYIGGEPASREQTVAWIAQVQRCWAAWGHSWWAFIDPASSRVAGAGCIQYARRTSAYPQDLDILRINPLEIGWRLHPDFWGKGLATEAAVCMAEFAFDQLKAPELIASVDTENRASIRVMERLGMRERGVEIWYDEPCETYVIERGAWLSAVESSRALQRHQR
jgi:RimJ/RimL family protein N-acetyltransferase